MDYPVEPDNDKKGKFGTALCEQGGFFMRNYRFGGVFLLAIRRAIRIYKTQFLEN